MQYSENMIVYTGRKALHIFDIDRERWVFSSTATGYQYDDIAESVRGNPDDESSGTEQEEENEIMKNQDDEEYKSPTTSMHQQTIMLPN